MYSIIVGTSDLTLCIDRHWNSNFFHNFIDGSSDDCEKIEVY